MKAELHESLDQHAWKLQDVTVTQLVLDPGGLRIVAWHVDGSAEFRLGSPFSYTEADGLAREIDPEQAEQVSPLLALVGRPLTRITVERSGRLELAFGDGSLLRIDPDSQFEAWEARGKGAFEGLAYLCGPGGGSPWGAA
ncbi:MAG TPA: DUF6188 family protein [Gemmatimonadales bacterium]|nr:DUF6188 family protein [Gemmatimonadales bacterium]